MLNSTLPAPPMSARASRSGRTDLWRWIVLLAVGLALTWLAVHRHARLGTASAPFIGSYRFKVEPGTLLAPTVAIAVLIAAAQGLHRRMPWRWLLLTSYLATAAWTFALALVDGGNGLVRPVTNPDEYLSDVGTVGTDPAGYLHDFVSRAPELSVATRQHPPLPVLLLWTAQRLGIHRPTMLGSLLTLTGILVVPLVAVATRSLAGERAGRELLPVLVLAPYAVWVAVSMDAVTAALGAGLVTAGVLASERRRGWGWRIGWAAGSGLLLGVAALFSYAVAWLGVSVICVYFVRRQPLLNVVTGVCALLPLAAAQLAGFVWTDGLTAAQKDFSERVGPHRSAVVWGFLGLVVLVVACGPAIVSSARKLRRTPAWPFLVGGALGVGFAVVAGLARGEAERSWLPFFPWLLVATVAPERPGGTPTSVPAPLLAVGAIGAVVLQAVLRTAW